jgi:PPM family protein phosphatase
MALTRDHTVVNEQVRLGVMITAGEASRRRRATSSAARWPGDLFVSVETSEHQVMPATFCCCAPTGCTGRFRREIAQLAGRRTDLPDAARELIDLANERDGSDNVSVLLIRIKHVERVGMYRGRPYKLPDRRTGPP